VPIISTGTATVVSANVHHANRPSTVPSRARSSASEPTIASVAPALTNTVWYRQGV
jgi:hypothetical protein